MSLWGSPVDISQHEPAQESPPSTASSPLAPDQHGPRHPGASSSAPVAESSNQIPVARLDGLFNFQIVVFQVEDTLFQVLKNGFMVPGSPFEAMFSLPTPSDDAEIFTEGSNLTNPIFLPGVSTNEFRAFLRILYPFIGPSIVASYEDWVGILNLATMWEFGHIREQAISRLSVLIKEKSAPERIVLGRKYHVKEWLKEEYITLAQKPHLKMEDLRDPSGIQLDWESVAKVMSVRDRNMLNNLREGRNSSGYHCGTCNVYYGYNHDVLDCRCRLQTLIDEVFKDEFQDLTTSSSEFSIPPPLPVTKGKGKKMKKKATAVV